MKTYLTKVFLTLFFIPFVTLHANDIDLRKLIRNSEFSTFMKAHAIDEKKLLKTPNNIISFNDHNFTLYEYSLTFNQSLFIVKSNVNGIMQYYYGQRKENYEEKEENSWIIVDKNYENIVNIDTDLNCVKETVAYMKKACSENTTCSISCDLSSYCTLYMYIVAYAHCTAGGQAPKASTISASTN